MIHQQIIEQIESFAPLSYQESYDNSGWQVGHRFHETQGALLTLDVTEDTVNEAIEKRCNLIISHHPVIFPHLKNVTADNWTGRLILKAIRNNVSIYTAHTNVDNVSNGVNAKFAEKLQLGNVQVLSPLSGDLCKCIVYSPESHVQKVTEALFKAGAGHIGEYSECSFTINGTGTFRPSENSNPSIGQSGGGRENVEEKKIEVITPKYLIPSIVSAVSEVHPYEEVAYDIIPLNNKNQSKGAGMIGFLENEMEIEAFLSHIKCSVSVDSIKYTRLSNKKIRKVALCGGSGSFLIKDALRQKCDAFITSDIKYHQFFDVEDKMMLIDIGHYETEQYTSEIFYDILKKKFPNFAVYISKINTNPIKYFS